MRGHRFGQLPLFPRKIDAEPLLLRWMRSENTHSLAETMTEAESSLFRRGFSSIYELLGKPFIDEHRIRQILNEFQPPDAELIAGYEVYALDCTSDPVPEAKTVPDLSQSKKGKYAPTIVEHRYSWLVRLIAQRNS